MILGTRIFADFQDYLTADTRGLTRTVASRDMLYVDTDERRLTRIRKIWRVYQKRLIINFEFLVLNLKLIFVQTTGPFVQNVHNLNSKWMLILLAFIRPR